ncbi:VOC family protein [Mycobacterium intracellulare]|uniref:Iron-dependent extradiol dioxygenase n=1 Tax=Mycobacterium intracellulare TaxID=1767 RepID=A0A7R7MT81_MYCIT|nr:VOC family protein [Mycobacterium intracellulare]BCO99368.1 iron-dependent extradiol dioxygenase [Mycobacterium intracellulare]
MKIRSIGYVGLNATDLSAWRGYAHEVLGVQVREDETKDHLLLKVDDYRWRIAVHQADVGGFAYAGLELPNARAFDEAVEELQQCGVEVVLGEDEEVKARAVAKLAVLSDPAGNRLELYYRPSLDYNFVSPHGARFVTGDMGFGHAVFLISAEQYDATLDFYVRTLGFRVSEYTTLGPVEVCFLHCNRRHHSIALGRAPFTACHHIMLQVEEIDMVGCALDRAQDAGVRLSTTLGRHRNDNMLSFYMTTPSGIDLEYGWGASDVDDDTWTVSEWVGGDVWGHRGLENAAGANIPTI